jgi:uncharacterized protein YecE (DUF72 family)
MGTKGAIERATVRIGTSGWVYPHWRHRFYPAPLKPAKWLSFYAHHFDTVEVNNSFYRLPSYASFRRWAQQTPDGFSFAVKGPRFITHLKKLRDVGEALQRFFAAVEGLGAKLAVVLWQLPPHLKADADRLAYFLRQLSRHCFYAVEFRHPSWWHEDAVRRVLERWGVAHCVPIAPPFPKALADIVTAPFVYLRFHGWDGIYAGCFPDDELVWWAERIAAWHRAGLTVFAYFNNDADAFAVQNACQLRAMVAQRLGQHLRR